MKEKIKKFFKDGRVAIVLIVLAEIFLMLLIQTFDKDDLYFKKLANNGNSVIDSVIHRYNTWTSRVIIEFVLIQFANCNDLIWIICNALICGLLVWSVSRLFIEPDKRKDLNILYTLLFLSYPMNVLSAAGWKATTINYIWPLAFSLYAMIPIKKYYENTKIRWFEYPLYTLALIFACNMEQACAILFGTYLLFMILLIIKEKRVRPFMIVQFILTHLSLIFILTCPGNGIRTDAEISSTFKDFQCYSFLEKIGTGIVSSIGDIVKWNVIPAIILGILTTTVIYKTHKEKLIRAVSLIPTLLIIYISLFRDVLANTFSYSRDFGNIFMTPVVQLTTANVNNLSSLLPILLSLIYYSFTILSLLVIFKNLKNCLPVLVYVVGFMSRVILGFASSVFLSAPRPMIFFEFAIFIVIILIMQELLKEKNENLNKTYKFIANCIGAVSLIAILNNMMFIL